MGVMTKKATLTATNLIEDINLLQGRNNFPENIVISYQGKAGNGGTETLDFNGFMLGNSTIVTADLIAQKTVAASNVVRIDASSTLKGIWKLRLTAVGLTAAEEIYVSITTW
jgi:hypothetical protein